MREKCSSEENYLNDLITRQKDFEQLDIKTEFEISVLNTIKSLKEKTENLHQEKNFLGTKISMMKSSIDNLIRESNVNI